MAIKRAIKVGDKSVISFKKAIKVGEITQWFDKDKFSPSQTDRTLTFTNNGDGSVTVSGVVVNTAKNIYSISNLKELVKGHKYLLSGCPKKTNLEDNYFLSLNIYNDNGGPPLNMWYDYSDGVIFTFDQEYYSRYIGGVYIYERTVGVEINRTYTLQLFDLTEMFGAGHEPATVAEFRAKFPETYYPYQRAVLTVYNKVVRPCARKGEVVQLVNPTIFNRTQTVEGVTYMGNINGTVSASGTSTGISLFDLKTSFSDIFSDHKYLITGCPEGGSLQTYNLRYSHNGFGDIGSGVIASGANIDNFRIVIQKGITVENLIFTPQFFDLTAMYGAGNEPKTLTEFRKDYPESYYPYSPIQTKNLFDIRKCTGLINSRLNNLSAGYFVKNLTQNSLTIKMGGYRSLACLKEPIILSAGTYTFSCDCDYDAINNGSGVRLGIYKKNEAGDRLVELKVTTWRFLHRLTLTFTLTEETAVYLELQGDGTSKLYNNLNNVFFNIQLEKGSVATDYVPHDYI